MALQSLVGMNAHSSKHLPECIPDNFAQIPFHPEISPNQFIINQVDDASGKPIKMNIEKGTTTIGFKYQGGVILAVDSRATGGQFIGSNSVHKILPINKYLVGTMCGGAADCLYWDRYISKECKLYELKNRQRMSTAAASKLLANILYQYKGYGLSMGVMICGWDKKGPGLYLVMDNGQRTSGNFFSVGSGSPYAYGVADSGYSWDMTDEQAIDLARRAVFHAAHRDSMSGGVVRVMTMKADGYHMVSEDDFNELYYKYRQEKEDEEMA